MSRRYNVQILSTGLYVYGGSVQSEEPEWFTCVEAGEIAGAIDRDHGRSVTRVNVAEFFAGSEEP